jgi:hypothetical protein
MNNIDQMEFPRKYPVPQWLQLAVVVMILAGCGIHYCSQLQSSREISISDVRISDYSRVHVEVEYTLTNDAKVDREVWLYLQVFDANSRVLANALFLVRSKGGSRQSMLKIIDKLSRSLDKNEKPTKATLEVYKKKVFS